MKSFLHYSLAIAIACLTMSANPAPKTTSQTLVSVYTANGTNFYGTLKIGGALFFNYSPTTYQYAGQVTTGPWTVTITCGAPGTHLYQFTGGYSQSSSTGTVTFNNVNITGTSTASIY